MMFPWTLDAIWYWMNLIEKTTVLAMMVMLLCTLYTLLLHFGQQRKAHIAAGDSIRVLKQKPTLGEAIAALNGTHLSSLIVLGGLEALQYAPSSFSTAEAVQLAESAMQRCERTVRLDAQRSLISLDTIVNIAPLIAMFATIFGIFSSFRGNDSKATGLQIVSFGVAFALIPWVLGLALAATAAWAYAYVSRGIERLDAQNASVMREVIGYLQTQSREQTATDSQADAAPVTRIQKEHHRGTRFMMCALWAWWLLPAIPMGIGIIWGIFSLFSHS